MPASALIQFTQGANTDAPGKAVIGAHGDFSLVTIGNGDNTGVTGWVVYLLDAPATSLSFPPGAQPQILAQATSSTPTGSFAPDLAGTYRVMLEVSDAQGNVDRDIRCFGIPDAWGFVRPPYQQGPEPLPVALPALISVDPRPVKPDEQNYESNVRGWSGNGPVGQLDDFFERHADLPFLRVDVTPFAALETDPPLHIVDLPTIGGPASFTLPENPRVGFVARVTALGPADEDVPATVHVHAGGSIGSGTTLEVVGDSGVVLVHRGSNAWAILSRVAATTASVVAVEQSDTGWDGTVPSDLLTLLTAGHTPGLYLVGITLVVTVAASGGSVRGTIAWTSPFGPETSQTSDIAVTAQGSKLLPPIVVRSDGSANIRVQFDQASAVVGSAAIDIYAGASVQALAP